MIVIDLGEERYDPPVDPDPPRRLVRRRLRTTALVLTGALVLGVGGGAPPAPAQLTEVYRGPLEARPTFALTGDRLFVTGPLDHGGGRRVTAYELDHGRRLWASPYRIERQPVGLYHVGGLLMVMEEWGGSQHRWFRTTALDADTGQRRWSVPNHLTVLPAERVALTVTEVFPEGSRVDPGDPPPSGSRVYVSGAGVYDAPPIGEVVRTIDLDTGRELWTSALVSGVLAMTRTAERPAALLTGHRDGVLELRDPRTGVVRQRLDPAAGRPEYATVVGDSLVVRHERKLAAYSADLRQLRWTRPLPRDVPYASECGPMVCLDNPNDVEVIDPATGSTAWRVAEPLRLRPYGAHLVEVDGQPALRRVVDPHTGRTVVDLAGWTEAVPPAEDGPLLLLRRAAGPRTWVGLLPPGGTAVRPLDYLPFVVSACRSTAGVIACLAQPDELRVWRYRPAALPAG
ncbi:PQQ-binding-like beta-propeller repeat protein [Plantactinospora sp. B6F1]|uniref:outer membrane protein assembly factor BamB family protein n=1 Tax=Plantactinospora sp. B6F1 TaxID=3158971 RepID=UPI0032D8FF91